MKLQFTPREQEASESCGSLFEVLVYELVSQKKEIFTPFFEDSNLTYILQAPAYLHVLPTYCSIYPMIVVSIFCSVIPYITVYNTIYQIPFSFPSSLYNPNVYPIIPT